MQKEKNKCANYFKKIFTKKERNKNKYGDFVVFRYEVRAAQTGEKLENEKMECEVVLEE